MLRAFATAVGIAGAGLLAAYSHAVYRLDCIGTLGYLVPVAALGVFAMAICGLTLLAVEAEHPKRAIIAAFVSACVIPATFLLAMNPLAARQRIHRHVEEAKRRIPILNAVVARIANAHSQSGGIPADQGAFDETIGEDLFGDEVWVRNGPSCCWGILYDRTDSQHYRLRYFASDILYEYQSAFPRRGWQGCASK